MQDLKKLFLSAVAAHRAGDLNAAEQLYKRILRARPEQFDTLNAFGHLERQRGRLNEAYALFTRALRLNARSSELLASRGNISLELGRAEEAIQDYDKALAVDPAAPTALINRGSALAKLHRHEEALSSYDRVLTIEPSFAPALYNRGNVLLDMKRPLDALASYDKALACQPDYAEAFHNRGVALRDLHCLEEAAESYRKAIALKPGYAEALNSLGESLLKLNRLQEALQSLDTALAIQPDFAGALSNRANVLQDLGRYEEAIAGFRQALKIDPDHEYAQGNLIFSELQVCDWSDYAANVERLSACVRASKRAAEPFVLTAVAAAPEEQYLCAKIWVADRYPGAPAPIWKGGQYGHPKIRVAYLSADFHDHAMAHLIAELFERHDQQRFETIGVSFGPDDQGEMRARLQRSFSRFLDVRMKSDLEVAHLMKELEIDIAVDLKGFTRDARTGILAQRPAPIQVNYLGYPGTMGADYVDYIIADRYVIPEREQKHYAEKVVYLPDSYQVNDSKRPIAERTPSRTELMLPDEGFVFCGFNQSYEIRPDVFNVWMRLLGKVQGSVLWLHASNAAALRNLRGEANRRGIAPERLIFAPKTGLDEHLARYRQADLFLDTLPVNTHTTASDALWAGLPVLTCMGSAFAGRVAASLLHAVGLPDLVTHSLEEYEQRALDLATTPTLLAGVRANLARNRTTHALFDTDRFRRHLESAYVTMWEKYQRGDRPASFAVEPVG